MVAAATRTVGTANYIGGSLREDLANFITQLSPESTPFLSTIGSNKATEARHDWLTDTLRDPVANAQPESFEFATANAVTDTPARLSNYTQVFGETIHVSGTLLNSDFAGAQNYFVYQRMKRGKELMRDIERKHLLYHFLTGTTGTNTKTLVHQEATATRTMGTLAAYAGNWNRLPTATVAAFDAAGAATAIVTTAGVGFNTRETDGTKAVQFTAAPTTVALTEAHINSLAQAFSDNNGMPTMAQVPTGLKARVSNLLIAGNGGAAQRRADEMAKRVNLAVDSVLTEFGFDIAIIPNYIMQSHASDASSSLVFYNPKSIKRSVLSPLTTKEDGTGRYGRGYIIFCDETLEVSDPNNVGIIIGAS